MNAAKPSPAQLKVLRALADGNILAEVGGWYARCWLYHPETLCGADVRCSFPTASVLHDRGWVEIIKEDWRGAKYRISPAGRAALKEADHDAG